MMNRIAIIAVTYNRLNSLKRLLDSLEKADYQNESPTLIISIDKSDTDSIEKFADSYVWPVGEKIVSRHEKNMGLKSHMMSLGNWFDEFETLVILEDDIVVSPCFYAYARQSSDFYMSNDEVAGISLYGFSMNYHIGIPFAPMKNEYDGYFMNCAMSWGEIWMKPQWQDFYQWYLDHQDFNYEPHLPESICKWDKSWLKYHTRYCIEQNKYFLHPYTSLSTNNGDTGTHNTKKSDSTYQVSLQVGNKSVFSFPPNTSKAVCYDGFFENRALCESLGLSEDNCCIDLYGVKRNALKKRYWLTTGAANFDVIRSFGLSYRPIELNVIFKNEGSSIFLYDTHCVSSTVKERPETLLYRYFIYDMRKLILRYGIKNLLLDLMRKINDRVCH